MGFDKILVLRDDMWDSVEESPLCIILLALSVGSTGSYCCHSEPRCSNNC